MKTVCVIELVSTLEMKIHSAQVTYPASFMSPAAVFLLKFTFKAKAKHFKLGWWSIVATWKDAKWLHCEALKGSKEEESRRTKGFPRLMAQVH